MADSSRFEFEPTGRITITTDFGTADGYVGAMKGRILSLAPEAKVEDLAHDVEPQNLHQASAALCASVPHWPAGTTHLAVIDPGVGSTRAAVVVLAGAHVLVGPDNGLLEPVARRLGFSGAWRIMLTAATRPFLAEEAAPTFHGRDIFAPIAAAIACRRLDPEDVGDPVDLAALPLPPVLQAGGRTEGRVLYGDRFGNAVTNLREDDITAEHEATVQVHFGREGNAPLVRTYSDVPRGQTVALIGSDGYLEIAVRDGSACRELGIATGDPVRVQRMAP